ncbi:MAG TPA: (d)CMP kinase [Lacibacter sp.]|nr:(d)CMP kinase [Lacibacter sp.]HMO89528.1 (d)CMP kinase [Lacibacter sp.]HMP86015.1 (d)CMP kinase [Lacibacter sp.]
MKKIIIAIDGYSSCGKSTLARQLARELDYVYIDSGAMYRAITLYFLRHHLDWSHPEAVQEALRQIELDFRPDPESGKSEIYLNGENVEYIIRDLVVAEKVSEVAALPDVRSFAVAQQRRMGQQKGIVMDGRDIGTTVFPDAELKIFMTADPDIRARRRYEEMQHKNPHVTLEEVKSNLLQRDHIDSTRAVSPLTQAADARLLDNSHLTPTGQLQVVQEWVRSVETA